MTYNLKPVGEQVMVITGASSGIGLATARMAAERGTRLVLAARNREALDQLGHEIGASAAVVAADVGREEDVRRIARTAIERFGGFDTWVNNAGASIYGALLEVSMEDSRRLFDTDFWGVVYGSLEAARHFRDRRSDYAGALINIGSVLSDRAFPLQGMYSAAKHAVKGFTDALRMELEDAGIPVSVTLIKPSGIDTPYTRHARNYMEEEPSIPPPVYSPDVVARAILHCAETPERDVTVGGGGKALAALGEYAPRLADRLMEAVMFRLQKKGTPPQRDPAGSLHHTRSDLQERGGYEGHVARSSLFTAVALHPVLAATAFVGAGLAAAAIVGAVRGDRDD